MVWALERPAPSGRVRVVFQSLTNFAPSKSVTAREWEALARMAGELEFEGVECSHATRQFERTMTGEEIEGLTAAVSTEVAAGIRRAMEAAGLSGKEWTFLVNPHSPYLWPMPESRLVSEVLWHVQSHLIPPQSAAKSSVNDAPTAPTLAEQHGAAKR